jgi:hypothetical protein
MALPDGTILKCVVTIELPDTVIAQNVWHWRLRDPESIEPTDIQILNAIENHLEDIYTNLQSSIANDVLVDEVDVDVVEWNPTEEYWETVLNVGSRVLGINGSNATDAVPHGVAAAITGDTAQPRSRARKFFPGFAENGVDDSTWSGGVLTALAAAIVDWLTDRMVYSTAVLEPGIPGEGVLSAGVWLPLISAAAQGIAAYQRRRKPGVGS